MFRNIFVFVLMAGVLGLPFWFRQQPNIDDWHVGDPELVIVTPNNEAIRYEFGKAFSRWYQQHYGKPVKVDWRALGGATEIMRYLHGAYTAAFRAYWLRGGKIWPQSATNQLLNGNQTDDPALNQIIQIFRSSDDPKIVSSGIDLLFGGGEYDHNNAAKRGLTVMPWPEGQMPEGLLEQHGIQMLPTQLSGETWRTPHLFGVALSTFGICYNVDRLRDLGVATPTQWQDLANPKLIGQVGVSDPTKSGSIAKAFEMVIQQQIDLAVKASGFSKRDIDRYEQLFNKQQGKPWQVPENVPPAYQQAIESGWQKGLQLIARIGGNARYFTDSATKVPIDISSGNAAMGMAIDFYGRYQAEYSRSLDGKERMGFITPVGGSSVSADPISLLRGAPHKQLAIRFMEFALGEDGQKLWNYRPDEPGGPEKYALRRLPIRRSFYPSEKQVTNNLFTQHQPHLTDDLAHPQINPYEVGQQFTYQKRWTAYHFNVHRNLIKAMCLDAGEELQAAWRAINRHGGIEKNPTAMAAFQQLPPGFTWRSAIDGSNTASPLETMRAWVLHFRQTFQQAKMLAERV